MDTKLTHLMASAAKLLEQAGPLSEPVNVTLDIKEGFIKVQGRTYTPINMMRSTIDQLAAALGGTASLHSVAGTVHSYRVQSEIDGIPVLAFALTPPCANPDSTAPTERTTSTSQGAELWRELTGWASGLDLSLVRALVMHDSGTRLTLQLVVADTGQEDNIAERAVADLPTSFDPRWAGFYGKGLLPTGHTLTLTTVPGP